MNTNIKVTKFSVAEITNTYYTAISNSNRLRPYNFLGHSCYFGRGMLIVDPNEKASKMMPKLRLNQFSLFWKKVEIDEAIEILNIEDRNLHLKPIAIGSSYAITTSGLTLSFTLDDDAVVFSRPTNRKELEELVCKLERAKVKYALDYADNPQAAVSAFSGKFSGRATIRRSQANDEMQFLSVLGHSLAERYSVEYVGIQRADTNLYDTILVSWGTYRLIFTLNTALRSTLVALDEYPNFAEILRGKMQDDVKTMLDILKKVNGHASDDDLVLMLSEHATYY